MTAALTDAQIRKALVTPVFAGDLGTVVPRFNALELAQVIERELTKAAANNLTSLRITLDLIDAAALANHLRGR